MGTLKKALTRAEEMQMIAIFKQTMDTLEKGAQKGLLGRSELFDKLNKIWDQTLLANPNYDPKKELLFRSITGLVQESKEYSALKDRFMSLEKDHQELKESMQKREEEQRQINAERDKKDAERDETLKMLMSLLPKTVSLDQASSYVVPLTQLSGGQGGGANSNHTVLTHYQSATLNETSQIVGNGINNSTSVQKPD